MLGGTLAGGLLISVKIAVYSAITIHCIPTVVMRLCDIGTFKVWLLTCTDSLKAPTTEKIG
jgi:hypothetical protein